MPVPTVTCVFCKKSVTKRSTLALDVLGAGDGRACRTHEEVAALVAQCATREKLKRDLSEAERKLRIRVAAAGVRVVNTLTGVGEECIYLRLRFAGYDDRMINDIRKEVIARGGPVMTVQEMGASILEGMALYAKKDA
jgi:hypothetical protein